jgi:hypothetical protein
MRISTITGINDLLRRITLSDILDIVILAGALFFAKWVLSILWTEYRWYLCLSVGSAVLLCFWFWWDSRKEKMRTTLSPENKSGARPGRPHLRQPATKNPPVETLVSGGTNTSGKEVFIPEKK